MTKATGMRTIIMGYCCDRFRSDLHIEVFGARAIRGAGYVDGSTGNILQF